MYTIYTTIKNIIQGFFFFNVIIRLDSLLQFLLQQGMFEFPGWSCLENCSRDTGSYAWTFRRVFKWTAINSLFWSDGSAVPPTQWLGGFGRTLGDGGSLNFAPA